jgi:hypothetical protein
MEAHARVAQNRAPVFARGCTDSGAAKSAGRPVSAKRPHPWSKLCRELTNEKGNAPPAFDRPKVRSVVSWIWELRQAEPPKGVTPMVDITVKMNAATFILVVLIVLKALRSANK